MTYFPSGCHYLISKTSNQIICCNILIKRPPFCNFSAFLRRRFRMRQVNIVGTSPPSQPSRKIETLPAPPDVSPANVTLRTASETSLWLRWVVGCTRSETLSIPCLGHLYSALNYGSVDVSVPAHA